MTRGRFYPTADGCVFMGTFHDVNVIVVGRPPGNRINYSEKCTARELNNHRGFTRVHAAISILSEHVRFRSTLRYEKYSRKRQRRVSASWNSLRVDESIDNDLGLFDCFV